MDDAVVNRGRTYVRGDSDVSIHLERESLLRKVDSPADLRNVAPQDLPRLAAEVRDYIIDVVSQRGGYLASNLGVVELTLALHYVLDTPNDKLIWDAGHQTYAA